MNRVSLFASLLCALAATPLWAEESAPACVEVSVDGYKAPDYTCMSQQMGNPEGNKAGEQNRAAIKAQAQRRAPNQNGLATPAATSVRMGNTFGTSVKPQRPTTP